MPKFGYAIGLCTAKMAEIDIELASMLAVILNLPPDSPGVLAIYLQIRRFTTQRDIITAAADHVLSPREKNIWAAFLGRLNGVNTTRNMIVHNTWGFCAGLKEDEILLLEGDQANMVVFKMIISKFAMENDVVRSHILKDARIVTLREFHKAYEAMKTVSDLLEEFIAAIMERRELSARKASRRYRALETALHIQSQGNPKGRKNAGAKHR